VRDKFEFARDRPYKIKKYYSKNFGKAFSEVQYKFVYSTILHVVRWYWLWAMFQW